MQDPATTSTVWSYPTTVLYGAGSLRKVGAAAEAAGIRRPLVVTDPGLAGLPVVARLLELLAEAGLPTAMFTELKSNPVGANVAAGVEALRSGDHDGVIAIGGGSALDTGKAVAFMAGQTRPIWDFEDRGSNWKRADEAGILPVIAIPTTAGTGSEVGRAGVITDEATHTKKIIFHPRMLPRTAILDPQATVGLPPALTAGTGMDACAHCLEAYLAPFYHPMSEGIALEGLRLVKEALPRAFHDGDDLGARGMMLTASAMGAVAFQKGLGAVHSLSHPVGAIYDTHHGLTNAVFMPYVLAFNRPAVEAKLTRLAAWLGLPEPGYAGLLAWILDLRRELAIPHTLAELEVPPDRFDELARMAAEDPTAGANPVRLGVAEARRLLDHAYQGSGI